ncbi:MAG: hypothetical protein COB84_10135 [Rhodobacteraceae bacterium]|nr:MAG: hypothetical protein COB84_10135 [Paracoccaceae bacterium]
MQVNAGGNAIKILQRLMQNFGQNLTVDGALGPKTCKIAHELWAQAPDHTVDAYGIARRNYYYQLADRRATSRKYARRRDGGKGGWIRRAEEFISPRFQLTDMEHQQRTASWA